MEVESIYWEGLNIVDCQEKEKNSLLRLSCSADGDTGRPKARLLVLSGAQAETDQVSLEEEELGEEEALQGDRCGGRGRGSLRGGQEEGEQEAGEVDEDSLCWVVVSISLKTQDKLTVNFISVGVLGRTDGVGWKPSLYTQPWSHSSQTPPSHHHPLCLVSRRRIVHLVSLQSGDCLIQNIHPSI